MWERITAVLLLRREPSQPKDRSRFLFSKDFTGEKDYIKGSCLSVVDNADFDVQNSTTGLYWKPLHPPGKLLYWNQMKVRQRELNPTVRTTKRSEPGPLLRNDHGITWLQVKWRIG
jgi:hypothetical protein